MPSEFDPTWDYSTQLVHAGERLVHPPGRPTTTPLYSSSTYYHESLDAFNDALAGHGYAYGRNGNPTNVAFEHAAAIAEGGTAAVSTGSGMAAIYTALLAAGRVNGRPLRTIVAPRDVYGATTVMLRDFFAPNGVQISLPSTHFWPHIRLMWSMSSNCQIHYSALSICMPFVHVHRPTVRGRLSTIRLRRRLSKNHSSSALTSSAIVQQSILPGMVMSRAGLWLYARPQRQPPSHTTTPHSGWCSDRTKHNRFCVASRQCRSV